MRKTRHALLQLVQDINAAKNKYLRLSHEIVELTDQAEVDCTKAHYDHALAALEKEIEKRPIGYRYTGVYYLKKPYTLPAVFEEHSGSLFMQEHLVSWQIENEQGKVDYAYYRAVYKKPDGALITRDDAKPVYSAQT